MDCARLKIVISAPRWLILLVLFLLLRGVCVRRGDLRPRDRFVVSGVGVAAGSARGAGRRDPGAR